MTGALRSLIVDDEPASRFRLRRLVGKRPNIEIVGEVGDGVKAVEQIEALLPDLLFLDVQMPGLDGFEVLRAIPAQTPLPLVIFITAFDEHALRAFQAQALAYLLKPVELDLLDAALERAWRIHAFQEQRAAEEARVRDVLGSMPVLQRIVARKGNRIALIESADICFFRMDAGLVRAYTVTDSYWVNYTMSDLEAGLSGKQFFRAHRSALVNLDQIAEVRPDLRSTYQLVMKDRAQTVIDVSERQGRALRSLIPGL
jgi:DNA-binding LytR/AlgR family response regulator